MMKDAESFLVGAKIDLDMHFEENPAVQPAFDLANAARGCRHRVEGADLNPFLGGVGHLQLPKIPIKNCQTYP